MEQKISDTHNVECLLNGCLFFSSTKLSRALNKMAEDAFLSIGLAPSYALLLYVVNEKSGIQPKEICELLHLTPSTITRFIEKLENKNLLIRKTEGKNVFVFSTTEGLLLQPEIIAAWSNLQNTLFGILTPEETKQFQQLACKILHSIEP